jgi:thioredoxin-dependent peroxiredoxin
MPIIDPDQLQAQLDAGLTAKQIIDAAPAPARLAVGDRAPDFELTAADGRTVSSRDLLGTSYVLYFYPAANTALCTTQACDLRDHYQGLRDAGWDVYGVSPDTREAAATFVEKQSLPFTLLVDPDRTVMERYGTWGLKNSYGRVIEGTIRSTFAIGADGTIVLAQYRVRTPGHAQKLLTALSGTAATAV